MREPAFMTHRTTTTSASNHHLYCVSTPPASFPMPVICHFSDSCHDHTERRSPISTVTPPAARTCNSRTTVNHRGVFFITKSPPTRTHQKRNPSIFASRRYHHACTILAHIQTHHCCTRYALEICSDQLKAPLRCVRHHLLRSAYCGNHHCSGTSRICSSHDHSRNHHQTLIAKGILIWERNCFDTWQPLVRQSTSQHWSTIQLWANIWSTVVQQDILHYF